MAEGPVDLQQIAQALTDLRSWRCSDGYCHLGGSATGMHTNGGCQCLNEIRDLNVRSAIVHVLRATRSAVLGRATDTPPREG